MAHWTRQTSDPSLIAVEARSEHDQGEGMKYPGAARAGFAQEPPGTNGGHCSRSFWFYKLNFFPSYKVQYGIIVAMAIYYVYYV